MFETVHVGLLREISSSVGDNWLCVDEQVTRLKCGCDLLKAGELAGLHPSRYDISRSCIENNMHMLVRLIPVTKYTFFVKWMHHIMYTCVRLYA